MKNEILQIAYSLEKGIINEETAKEMFLDLFNVSDSSKIPLTLRPDYLKGWNDGLDSITTH